MSGKTLLLEDDGNFRTAQTIITCLGCVAMASVAKEMLILWYLIYACEVDLHKLILRFRNGPTVSIVNRTQTNFKFVKSES